MWGQHSKAHTRHVFRSKGHQEHCETLILGVNAASPLDFLKQQLRGALADLLRQLTGNGCGFCAQESARSALRHKRQRKPRRQARLLTAIMVRVYVHIGNECVQKSTARIDNSVGSLRRHASRVCNSSDALDLAGVKELHWNEFAHYWALEDNLPTAERRRTALCDLKLQPFVNSKLSKKWQSNSSQGINRRVAVVICNTREGDATGRLAKGQEGNDTLQEITDRSCRPAVVDYIPRPRHYAGSHEHGSSCVSNLNNRSICNLLHQLQEIYFIISQSGIVVQCANVLYAHCPPAQHRQGYALPEMARALETQCGHGNDANRSQETRMPRRACSHVLCVD
eukprot:Opistho-2@47263